MSEAMMVVLQRNVDSLEAKVDQLVGFVADLNARHDQDVEEILRLRAALRSISNMDVHPSYEQAKIARDALEVVTDA